MLAHCGLRTICYGGEVVLGFEHAELHQLRFEDAGLEVVLATKVLEADDPMLESVDRLGRSKVVSIPSGCHALLEDDDAWQDLDAELLYQKWDVLDENANKSRLEVFLREFLRPCELG